MVGALGALQESIDTDLRTFDYIVGTSAGSVIGAMLGAGIDVRQLRSHQLGEVVDGPLAIHPWDYDTATGGSKPPRPRLGAGSPRMMARNVRRLRRMPPTAVLSGLVPEGRGSLTGIGGLIEAVIAPAETVGAEAGGPDTDGHDSAVPALGETTVEALEAGPGSASPRWSPHQGLWIVAMDYETGRRVPFGSPDAPPASLADAVMASCAIPGWFTPVTIGGHRYIDGGTCSSTSVDLLAGLDLDEVYVVAPMVSFQLDHPTTLLSRLERRWRRRCTRRCVREARKLRAQGTRVRILGPGPEDLEAIGANIMDTGRRLTVLETSLRTSARALATLRPRPDEG